MNSSDYNGAAATFGVKCAKCGKNRGMGCACGGGDGESPDVIRRRKKPDGMSAANPMGTGSRGGQSQTMSQMPNLKPNVLSLIGDDAGQFLASVHEAHRALSVAVYPLLTNTTLSDNGAKFLADSAMVLGRLASINRRATESHRLNSARMNVTQESVNVVRRAYDLADRAGGI